jgi:hypothetical protein
MPGVIDRRALVQRHNPVLTSAHPTGVLTVGNGDAALSVDLSGLQTFPAYHSLVPDPQRVVQDGLSGLPEQPKRPFDIDDFQIPLRTQSTWGWYETRPVREFRYEETVTEHETARGPVQYADKMGLQRAGDPIAEEFEAGAWFHFNPRRTHLGRLALVRSSGGRQLSNPEVVQDVRTELDLWSGRVRAEYTLEGERVVVTTVADPVMHRFATRVESTLLRRGWAVAWVFDAQPDEFASFEGPLAEHTAWSRPSDSRWVAHRQVEASTYDVDVVTTGALSASGDDAVIATTDQASLEVVVTLSPGHEGSDAVALPRFSDVLTASSAWWQEHWEAGAAVSFDGSSDERARELERRVVLSQYLTAVNGAGATPPAETGLTYNTWTGKFHLEMHWWHAAHFAMWSRGHLLERSLDWYHSALDAARATAQWQGYRGARWPKHTDPSARESPSNIGVFLVWQQPHLIYLLELLRQGGRDLDFMSTHYPLIEATAEFMGDFVDERNGSFVLPPPLIPAQESYLADRATNESPTFELAYWVWALSVANEWRAHLGLPIREDWDRIARSMRRPAQLPDGTYAAIATAPFLIREDHPSMLMALGWLPDTGVIDPEVMSATLEQVWNQWDLQSTWGWDYPVMAMTAARLGDLGRAIDALLLPSPKNEFLPNGHNPQVPGFLTLYLPANGGLLAAVAHIAAALDSGAELPAGWEITVEGLRALPTLFTGAASAS